MVLHARRGDAGHEHHPAPTGLYRLEREHRSVRRPRVEDVADRLLAILDQDVMVCGSPVVGDADDISRDDPVTRGLRIHERPLASTTDERGRGPPAAAPGEQQA